MVEALKQGARAYLQLNKNGITPVGFSKWNNEACPASLHLERLRNFFTFEMCTLLFFLKCFIHKECWLIDRQPTLSLWRNRHVEKEILMPVGDRHNPVLRFHGAKVLRNSTTPYFVFTRRASAKNYALYLRLRTCSFAGHNAGNPLEGKLRQ